MIIAGKMHSSGIDEALVDLDSIERFIDAGADIYLNACCLYSAWLYQKKK